jgi:hypothetical protein
MHMRRLLPMAAVVILVAAAVVLLRPGGSGTPERARAAAPDITPSPGAPPVEPFIPCQLRVSPNVTVALTTREARIATQLAAASLRARGSLTALATILDAQLVAITPTKAPGAARVLRGLVPAYALNCAAARPVVSPEEMGRSGLTPRAAALRAAVLDAIGPVSMGGFRAGGLKSGHVDNSAHYDGRAIDVFINGRTTTGSARGWTLAQWLVAHAEERGVLSVIWSDRIWTIWASGVGWRPYVHPSGNTTNPTLRHLDHVHTAVISGRSRGFMGPR